VTAGLGTYYQRPVFRPGTQVAPGQNFLTLTYDQFSLTIDFSTVAEPFLRDLLQRLATGLVSEEFLSVYPDLGPQTDEILEALDRYGFLTEAEPTAPEHSISGAAFWQEVAAFATRWRRSLSPPLYPALCRGDVGRAGLVAYALQYYYVVRNGPPVIAGMLPHAADASTRAQLEEFLVEELGHEHFLLDALSTAGMTPTHVQESLPWPETFAIISALQVMADQEPLSFKACIFLMEEESAEFHRAFVEACERAGLDEGFWGPIVQHAHINESGEHASITERLLSREESVSTEARIVALKQLAALLDALVALEHAVLAHAATDGTNPTP
jgi:hypothetical protein